MPPKIIFKLKLNQPRILLPPSGEGRDGGILKKENFKNFYIY